MYRNNGSQEGKAVEMYLNLSGPTGLTAPGANRRGTGLLPVDRVLHHQHLALIPRPLLFLQ